MQASDSQQFTTILKRILRYRKRIVLLGLIVGLLPAIAFNQLQTPVYEAATSMVFDEVAAPVPSGTDDVSRDILLSNRLEELSSYAFAQEIAASLPSPLRQRFAMPEDAPAPIDTLAVAAKQIQDNLLASPVRNSNVVQVAVQLPDARLAAAVANAAARVYQDRNDRIRRQGVGGVRRFVEEQMERTRSQLDSSEAALRNYKEANHITSFDSEAQEVLRRNTEAEVLYNEARANRGAAEEKLAAVQQTLAKQKQDLVPSMTEASSPAVVRLRERLGELQSQYVELKLQGYAPTHPKMADLQQAIDETKRNLTEEATKLASGSGIADPLAQMERYATDAASLLIDIESFKAQENALKRVIDGYDTALGRLPEKEFQLARLTRERDVNHKIYTMLLEKLEETRIAEAERLPTMRILDTAPVPKTPIRPRKPLNLMLGLFLGALLGGGTAFGLESLRGGVESELELQRLTGWKPLGSIPRIDRVSSRTLRKLSEGGSDTHENRRLQRGLITLLEPESGPSEAFRMLRTSLQFQGVGSSCRTLLVTSVGPGDGKSTTLANLAIGFAALGDPVVVVDAEVRRPVQHSLFGVPRAPGLTDILLGAEQAAPRPAALPARRESDKAGVGGWREATAERTATLAEVELPAGLLAGGLRPTRVPNLSILTTGQLVPNPGDRLVTALPFLRAVVRQLRDEFPVVLVDAPPLLLVHDTAYLAKLCDGVLFVVSSHRAERDLLARARERLETSGANVLGTALNSVDPGRVYGYDTYYGSKH
jgi:polysaccharide biosynthesis transport protein